MKILVAWDSESELELISMYLGIEENEVTAAIGAEAFEAQIASGDHFDVVLMCIDMPDVDSGYALFDRFRKESPNSPVVGACRAEEVIRIIKFMANGMKAYVIRDTSGDFMFMLHAVLNSTIDAVRSARNEELAEKLREEVESVRKLQQSVIPKRVDAPDGYEIIGRYELSQIRVLGGQPVTMAGGDYYDVFRLPDDNIVLLVGDASGHGMKAAMSIMTMHTLVRMIRTHEYRDTAHFVEVINKQLCEQSIVSEEGGFITMLYALLDVQKGELQWTSAGHPPRSCRTSIRVWWNLWQALRPEVYRWRSWTRRSTRSTRRPSPRTLASCCSQTASKKRFLIMRRRMISLGSTASPNAQGHVRPAAGGRSATAVRRVERIHTRYRPSR